MNINILQSALVDKRGQTTTTKGKKEENYEYIADEDKGSMLIMLKILYRQGRPACGYGYR
jgi:hypothetical protein